MRVSEMRFEASHLSRLAQGVQAQIVQLLDDDALLQFMSTCQGTLRLVFDSAKGIQVIITDATQVGIVATLLQDVAAARLSLQVRHTDQLDALCQLRALGVEAKEVRFQCSERDDRIGDEFQLGGARAALAAEACLGVQEVALCNVNVTDAIFFSGLAAACASLERLMFSDVFFAGLVEDSPKNVHGLADLSAHLPAACELEVACLTLAAPFAANPTLLARITSLAAGPRGCFPDHHTDPEDEAWYSEWDWEESLRLMTNSFHRLHTLNLDTFVLTPALVKALSACPNLTHICARVVCPPKGGRVCTNQRPPALQCLTVQLQYVNYIAKLPWLAQVPELRLEGLSFWTCSRQDAQVAAEIEGAVAGDVDQAVQMLAAMPCLRLGTADGKGMTVSMEAIYSAPMSRLLGALAPLAHLMPHTATILSMHGPLVDLALALTSVFWQCRTISLPSLHLSAPPHNGPFWAMLLEALPHLSTVTVGYANLNMADPDEDTSDGHDDDDRAGIGEGGNQESDLYGASVDENGAHGQDAHGACAAMGSPQLHLDALASFVAEFGAACCSLGKKVYLCVEEFVLFDEYGNGHRGLTNEQAAALNSEYVRMVPHTPSED